jgi:hypothetical protein
MSNLIEEITGTENLGNNYTISILESRLAKLTSLVNYIYILLSIFATALIITKSNTGLENYGRYLLLIPSCLINITFIHFRYYLLAKILTLFMPFFIIFVTPIFIPFIHEGMFLWFPYGIMITGAVSFYLLSFEKEKFLLHCAIILFTIAVIFYDRILLHYSPFNNDVSFIYKKNYIYYQTSKVGLVVFLYTSLYLAKLTAFKLRLALIALNVRLDQKNNELRTLNEELEAIVRRRTEILDLQNKRIKKLAFSIAHGVRASVARISGLINFIDNEPSEKDKELIIKYIKKSTEQLEEETNKISNYLVEES